MINSTSMPQISIYDYEKAVTPTDRFADDEITPILLGLFGEVGSVMSSSKKLHREKGAFESGYRRDVEEELGDTLWYAAALCRRLKLTLSELFVEATSGDQFVANITANSDPSAPIARVMTAKGLGPLDNVLLKLGQDSARLLGVKADEKTAKPIMIEFVRAYIQAVQSSGVSFSEVLESNIRKSTGRFLKPSPDCLPDFDAGFLAEEQLPRQFEIEITQRSNGRSYLRWNGVFIGDPLTDNIADPDGYRFHDVFHFANAAILHWSPTFRALIKHKRKSDPRVDEAQDSGRAIVVDEGVSAYIFSEAKALNFFESQNSVSFDLLKAVSNFVRGYEVERCPLNLWETAILQGYEVFRQMRKNNGGIVVGNRDKRTIEYRPLKGA
ncbi:nucleoside triphosphate pyrophosphohydrolase family protein [Rhodobacter sp. NTK016B]|uniref:nucleoside triphosphate pyrophosphohydrolase family protein n=1 Tax=Rhodobacter sp. NTK016B TaxID=2759676 RepID=UPI001A900434|nr:nucleoside triphosphate pyrophosphohydrolase family protein [Rhodobacter sp. NTK016B]MBN8291420.1 nucleoside triphosphate pyrophosphohydrolase family protein [Rhodobacter sp. NTK016B]